MTGKKYPKNNYRYLIYRLLKIPISVILFEAYRILFFVSSWYNQRLSYSLLKVLSSEMDPVEIRLIR
jgi:hypothetical protein